MATDFTSGPSIINMDTRDIDIPTFSLKKRSKKSSSKKAKKANPPTPPIPNDENNTPSFQTSSSSSTTRHRSRLSSSNAPTFPFGSKSCKSYESKSKSPSLSKIKQRKKSLHDTSDILKLKPSKSLKTKSRRHSKAKLTKDNKSKNNMKRRKGSRSRNSVNFTNFELNVDSDPDDEETLALYLGTLNEAKSVNKLKKTSSHKRSSSSSSSHQRARSRGSSITSLNRIIEGDGGECHESALLKRLKTENKELRKSRNLLRKDHDILQKIESKLRHKLEIILAKFKQIAIDIDGDQTDWTRLQKMGDIEGVLEAVFAKFNQITDQYMKRQKVWKEQQRKWQKLKEKWQQFQKEYNMIETTDENTKPFEGEYMFNCLKQKLDGIEGENNERFNQLSMVISKSQDTNKEQQCRLDELEGELVVLRKKSEDFNLRENEFQQQYLSMTQRLEDQQQEFEASNLTMVKKLKESEDEREQYKEINLLISSKLENKMEEITKANQYKENLEADNKELRDEIERIKLEMNQLKEQNEHLKVIDVQCKLVKDQLSDTQNKLSELKKENVMILQRNERMEGELRRKDVELTEMESENMRLTKRSTALDELQSEYIAIQKQLKDKQGEIDRNEHEFQIICKAKENAELENERLRTQSIELQIKMDNVETENRELNAIVNKPKNECGTQTDFAFILEDAHLKALQKDNAYLMKELNFLIAERSRFKPCSGDTDFHHGDINSMVVSPINYSIATGGKHDNSVRIWKPKSTVGSEITFIPTQKAFVDGTVLSVNMSEDGVLMAAGCSLKKTPNGYVVVWNLKDNGSVLCNLRSRTLLRFGKVHCVTFMKYDDIDLALKDTFGTITNKTSTPRGGHGHKRGHSYSSSSHRGSSKSRKSSIGGSRKSLSYKKRGNRSRGSMFTTNNNNKSNGDGQSFNYLLFGGDTTGCILCWNLASENCQTPVCVINGHTDIIYDLSIVDNKWLFSVSHDESLMYCNIETFPYKKVENQYSSSMDYVFSKKLFKDDSKYPLQSVIHNDKSNELIFGSRKCNIFMMNQEYDEDDEKNEGHDKYFKSKQFLNTKDLDHICNLRMRDNLMIVQRNGINYVKVFNLDNNKLIKTYQIDDGDNDCNKFKIYDCGITFDRKYSVLCVGIFNKENLQNLNLNRSALKGFKIPKSSSKKQ